MISAGRASRSWGGRDILLVEDNSARAHRRPLAGVASSKGHSRITVRLHRINGTDCKVLAERSYRAGLLQRRSAQAGKAKVALDLIESISRRAAGVVVAGPVYGCNTRFLAGLAQRDLDYVVEVRPSTPVHSSAGAGRRAPIPAIKLLLRQPKWKHIELAVPHAAGLLKYRVAPLGDLRLPGNRVGRLFAAQVGGIPGVHRGTIFGLASRGDVELSELLRVVGWVRWIWPATRKEERGSLPSPHGNAQQGARRGLLGAALTVRSNIALARRQDEEARQDTGPPAGAPSARGVLASLGNVLNVAELFAGAGGMGLGFLLAGSRQRRYRVVFSGEVNPIYVQTLRNNHDTLAALRRGDREDHVPEQVRPVDLRTSDALAQLRRCVREVGALHILIGGPPCQGFSNANRNSWHSANPHNRLIDVFLNYVKELRPAVFLLENVQGILWTPRRGRSATRLTVSEHLERRMKVAGYSVFPKLLDAVWYGVPQYRSRFFLLGLRREFGCRAEDFGPHGPFPAPTHGPGCPNSYVTVRDAIGDLPRIRNGSDDAPREYREQAKNDLRTNLFLSLMRKGGPRDVIHDHITSRHANYVIERYRQIPEGGNWQDIAHTLTNYSNVERTHSNIYRRLKWNEPSITIGHYRKSMLVHPSQHRGLSLREACRLQSFPDWFRFSGRTDIGKGGLVHKQQQLANAVSPLVTKALADFILRL